MKSRNQLIQESEIVVAELRKAFNRCRRKVDDDSFIAHIALAHFIELIIANEGMKSLNDGVERAKEAYELIYDSDGGSK